ncbi:MAG: hypothetical protein JST05_01100 [Acidobacteria bacterium]|nr:hypothetical protein [Acidobacteriota bacterium]
MPRRKREAVDLEDLGGEISWTEEGITLFIPQEVVQHWRAAQFLYDEDEDRIMIVPTEGD